MDTEIEADSSSQLSQPRKPARYERAKHARKKKFVVFIVAVGASAVGILAYLDRSPDPTTWESMRTDYKNTK